MASWHDAPKVTKLTASQQGGKHGAQIWGVDNRGVLHTTFQNEPGNDWSPWKGPDWAGGGFPKQVYELAATQQHDGRVILFVLNVYQELWIITQNSPGDDWANWHKPEWDGMRRGDLKKLCAAPQGSKGYGMMWALTSEGTIVGNHQERDVLPWFQGWYDWHPIPDNSPIVEITAARQGNGHTALWALDNQGRLWCIEQTDGSAGQPSGWGKWSGPNWQNSPKLRNIAACQGKHGALLWGIDAEEYRIYHNFQLEPGGKNWGGWQIGDWLNGPRCYEITAAGQNNGCAQVWVVGLDQNLYSIAQTGGECFWERVWTPNPKTNK